MKDTIRLHIVFLFDRGYTNDLIQISKALNTKKDNMIELGSEMIPHVTVYAPEIPAYNYEESQLILEKLCQNIKPIILKNPRYEKPPRGDNGLFVNYGADKDVLEKQQEIIDIINPFREGTVRKKWIGNKEYSDEINMYGYPMSQFHFPHVTLARFQTKKQRDDALDEITVPQENEITVRSVAIVETGKYGTAKRIIKEYKLDK